MTSVRTFKWGFGALVICAGLAALQSGLRKRGPRGTMRRMWPATIWCPPMSGGKEKRDVIEIEKSVESAAAAADPAGAADSGAEREAKVDTVDLGADAAVKVDPADTGEKGAVKVDTADSGADGAVKVDTAEVTAATVKLVWSSRHRPRLNAL